MSHEHWDGKHWGNEPYVPEQQSDAVISQANPVSTTLYPVLNTTSNVRIIGASILITWAVTQPTPLDLVMTVDGQSIVFKIANPVSAQAYNPIINPNNVMTNQPLITGADGYNIRGFLLEGRSVTIEARITWGVTQPTPLDCRVKWAKW